MTRFKIMPLQARLCTDSEELSREKEQTDIL